VLIGRHGTPVDPRTLNRRFGARCEAAGVRAMTVHDARRTCATLLVDLDVHPRVIMRILRHAKLTVKARGPRLFRRGPLTCVDAIVGLTGFEPAASSSRTRRRLDGGGHVRRRHAAEVHPGAPETVEVAVLRCCTDPCLQSWRPIGAEPRTGVVVPAQPGCGALSDASAAAGRCCSRGFGDARLPSRRVVVQPGSSGPAHRARTPFGNCAACIGRCRTGSGDPRHRTARFRMNFSQVAARLWRNPCPAVVRSMAAGPTQIVRARSGEAATGCLAPREPSSGGTES
jgi:hypothetical protein